jgi:hypothetical protein
LTASHAQVSTLAAQETILVKFGFLQTIQLLPSLQRISLLCNFLLFSSDSAHTELSWHLDFRSIPNGICGVCVLLPPKFAGTPHPACKSKLALRGPCRGGCASSQTPHFHPHHPSGQPERWYLPPLRNWYFVKHWNPFRQQGLGDNL